MVGSMYAAIAGLRTHQQKMNVIGHNIANANTYGYKSQRTTFKESMYSSIKTSTPGTATSGGSNAAQIGYGCTVGTIDMNMRSGNYAITDRTRDIMIDGDGFLITSPIIQGNTDDGLTIDENTNFNNMNLTRVGNLDFDSNGYLVDGGGNVVYGYRWEGTAYKADGLFPLRIPMEGDLTNFTDDGDRAALNSISINEKGEVIGQDENGTEVHIGCIAMGYVDNPNGLTHKAGPYYAAGGNAGNVRPGACGGAVTGDNIINFPTTKTVSGALEMSNVDISNEFADLITTQRGFQANTKIITVTDEMLSDLVSMKR